MLPCYVREANERTTGWINEDQNEKPEQKVLAILDKIEEKPQISGCVRLGQIKLGVVRHLRFRVRSQDNVYQILRKASGFY